MTKIDIFQSKGKIESTLNVSDVPETYGENSWGS